MNRPMASVAGSLFLVFGLWLASAAPVLAKTTLGIIRPGEAPTRLTAEFPATLGGGVAIRTFSDERVALDWLLRFREIEAALLPQPLFAAQSAGALISAGTVKLASGPSPGSWILAVRGDLPREQQSAIATAFQELLQQEAGLLLVERLINPAVTDQAPHASAPDPTAVLAPAAPVEAASRKAVGVPPSILPPSTPPIAEAGPLAPMVSAPSPAQPPAAPEVEAIQKPVPRPEVKPAAVASPGTSPPITRTNQQKWIFPHLEIQGKLGNERSLADAEIFFPVFHDRISLLFLDLRFQLDDDEATEGNFGLGFRRLLDDWIAGGYAFYDVRESSYDNTFRQVTLGAEALAENYDARFNLYLADEDKEVLADIQPSDVFGYLENRLVHSTTAGIFQYEKSLSGIDFEFGGRLQQVAYPEVRGYLGGYFFDASEVDSISGPRARLEVRFSDLAGFTGSLFEVGGEVTHDSERDTDYYLSARLRIPLDGYFSSPPPRLTPLERRMTERVRRDPDIVMTDQRQVTPAAAPQSLTTGGVPITVTHIASGAASGAGTRQAPFGSLTAAAGAGSDIVLLHAGSVFTGEGFAMADNQRLLGEYEGMPYTVATDQFGTIGLPSATGNTAKPLIDGALGAAIQAAGNGEVAGLVIHNPGGAGLSIDGAAGSVTVSDVVITDSGAAGVVISDSSANVTLHNVDITTTGQAGVALLANSGLTTISGGAIDDTGKAGISAVNSSLSVSGMEIGATAGIGAEGITLYADNGLESTFSITGSTIANTAGHGLAVEADNGATITSGTVMDTQLNNVGGDGINFWAHGGASIASLQVGDPAVATRPSGIGTGDVSIGNTGGAGIHLLAGDRNGLAAGDTGTLTAIINAIDISGTGGDNNINLFVYGNGTGAYTVTNSSLAGSGAITNNIDIEAVGSVNTDAPLLTSRIENNLLAGSPEAALYAESNSGGTINLRVIGNDASPAGNPDADGMAFQNFPTATFSLYLQDNFSTPAGVFDGYYLMNNGVAFNLGATAGNPGVTYAELIGYEGNSGSVLVDNFVDLIIVDEATIPTP